MDYDDFMDAMRVVLVIFLVVGGIIGTIFVSMIAYYHWIAPMAAVAELAEKCR